MLFAKAALSNTGIPKVDVAAETPGDEQPEVNISDEEFLQFDTSGVPVIVTLTKVKQFYCSLKFVIFFLRKMFCYFIFIFLPSAL